MKYIFIGIIYIMMIPFLSCRDSRHAGDLKENMNETNATDDVSGNAEGAYATDSTSNTTPPDNTSTGDSSNTIK